MHTEKKRKKIPREKIKYVKPEELAEARGGAEVAKRVLIQFVAPRGSHRLLHDACTEKMVLREQEAKNTIRSQASS